MPLNDKKTVHSLSGNAISVYRMPIDPQHHGVVVNMRCVRQMRFLEKRLLYNLIDTVQGLLLFANLKHMAG